MLPARAINLNSKMKFSAKQHRVHKGHFLAVWLLLAGFTQGEEILPAGNVAATAPAEVTAVAGSGGTINVNELLGADRYYNYSTPITGQGSITYNLEAGHIWNGHETLAHVTEAAYSQTSENVGGGAVAPLYDRHATWVGMLIGGRETAANQPYQQGMAPGTDLRSAAIASVWYPPAYALSFDITPATYLGAFNASFGTADVVNSSFGYYDPGGSNEYTIASDAYAWQNSKTTYVTSAGNSGTSGDNTVRAPGAGYNTVTVAALTKGSDPAKPYDSVASFSSHGPQDFEYYNPAGGLVTVPGVRAAVDIAAPGDQITSAYYGGTTGGNTGAASGTTNPAAYSASIAGTSFSSPLVAGGAALLASAAHVLPQLNTNLNATQSTVIKSLLLTGADKTARWSNGLATVTVGSDTFLRTTQSLDWTVGAGRMNLDKTFDLQLSGTRDVPGTATGLLCTVDPLGWDYGMATRGSSNDYVISTPFDGMTQIDTTISWQRVREIYTLSESTYVDDVAQADLNLSFWSLDMSGPNPVFSDLIAESSSLYNTVEHLSFQVPASGYYGIRVSYLSNIFDNSLGEEWGNLDYPQAYGLAWSLTAIPETTSMVPLAVLLVSSLGLRLRRGARSC
jgi:hypothetical protein